MRNATTTTTTLVVVIILAVCLANSSAFLGTGGASRASKIVTTTTTTSCRPRKISPSTERMLRLKLSSSSSSSSSLEDIKKKQPQQQPTMVYALILGSMASFVLDNVLKVQLFQSFYLNHFQWKWWQLITSTFCHANRSHLSGNTFLLLLFGRSVEDELGSPGLLVSYLFCGILANVVSLFLLPRHTVSLGASGAVYGLFAVSIVARGFQELFQDWRKVLEVTVLGQFVVSRISEEAKTAVAGGTTGGGINHVAHLAGAGAGVLLVVLLRTLIRVLERNETKRNK
eukprot:CAMPEP_0178928850 /NCGR_PEP_ID=MMETSP0786-20121207/20182_1 /TAXON_ID=186022 /ORGANISM="Thalassionema frauenfeldii, Strain CCMP 1798" /LENGTH=284 /DNA_ID=CAMNT_0020604859 /DNA_START=96 /DNA_END=950 /DNA_ORIENTATION=-